MGIHAHYAMKRVGGEINEKSEIFLLGDGGRARHGWHKSRATCCQEGVGLQTWNSMPLEYTITILREIEEIQCLDGATRMIVLILMKKIVAVFTFMITI